MVKHGKETKYEIETSQSGLKAYAVMPDDRMRAILQADSRAQHHHTTDENIGFSVISPILVIPKDTAATYQRIIDAIVVASNPLAEDGTRLILPFLSNDESTEEKTGFPFAFWFAVDQGTPPGNRPTHQQVVGIFKQAFQKDNL